MVTLPIQHDSAAEMAQPLMLEIGKRAMRAYSRKTAPHIICVERDYPNTYARFTSLGPLMDKLGNGGKGINWNTQDEIDFLKTQ